MKSTATLHRWVTRATIPVVAMMVVLASADRAVAGCNFAAMGEGRVDNVIDGRTVRLADGREVRLAGIEIATTGTAHTTATAALAHLVTGHTVTLQGESETPDRYGRQRAFAFLEGADTSVQALLLDQGAALASGTVADLNCAVELLAAEASARTARRGIWEHSIVIKNAESSGDILARVGQFTLVEGKVRSARQAGATFYINFGKRWTDGFAVTIPRRMMPLFERTGIPLKSLENRQIRVRGWIERRGGPRIEASRPGQIELMGD